MACAPFTGKASEELKNICNRDKMKKALIFIISLFVILSVFSSPLCAYTVVKVGIYQNIPLAFTGEDSAAKGFFIDILEHIASKEDWTVRYFPGSREQCIKQLYEGRLDLLAGITYSEKKDKRFDYAYESVLSEWAQIYTQKGSSIESIVDLNDKKIAVLYNSIHYAKLLNLINQFGIRCRIIVVYEYKTIFEIIENGECDAGVVGFFYGMQHENLYDISRSPVVFNPQKLYFAVPEGKNQNLIGTIDTNLRELKEDRKSIYYTSMNSWLGVGSSKVYAKWLLWTIAAIVSLFFLFFITSIMLRIQVNSRTKELYLKNEELVAEIEQRKLGEVQKAGLETRLQRSQKMEALGTLAGGVAHDLNNILSGIVSYPELLLLDIPHDSPLRKPILTIQESGEKAATIVQDLLTLARRGVLSTEVVDLNNIISDYLKSPEYEKLKSYHYEVRVETNLEKDPLNISGSPVHLSKTVMNLVSNAAEAILGSGKVIISTENRYIDSPISGYDHVEEGDYATLMVSDTGIGISSEDIERIFEPFYTKKVMGRSGTGLGMAVVWGTVKDHNGYIDVYSVKGSQTTFTLYFPVTRQELSKDKVISSIKDYMGKGESILIIDDIKTQREIASGMLKKLGYKVKSVSSGEEAVEYLERNSTDLLVLDMIMDPGIDGLETYKKIIKIYPHQKAIIASGFSETERVKQVQRLGAGPYVKKPYFIEKIGRAVRSELDR